MPIYEYECAQCGAKTEALRSMAQADAAIACTACGSKKTRRLQSVFSAASGSESSLPIGPCGQHCDGSGSCPMDGN